ncbi:MAG: CvpA family protein, partial [Desulfuromonadales bacterium]|nr:CvpA family protein [Desulfuromonadales bacterium]NIR34218.1 CvpA family protein [Desulfuromonadales bacterium]NIS41666.1 CvpA family protein [Desulfuromonadales bacterium]
MNGLDIAILITLGVFTLKGLLRGLLRELCSLIGIVAGSFLAFYFHPPLANWLAAAVDLPPRICVIAAFLVLFLVTVSLFAVLGYLLSQSISALFLGGINQVVGGCFG